jgi:hypothetical protein
MAAAAPSLSNAQFGEFKPHEQAQVKAARTHDLAALPTVTVDPGIHHYKDEAHEPIRQRQELKIAKVTHNDVLLQTSVWDRAGDKLTVSLGQLFNDFSPKRSETVQSSPVHQPVHHAQTQSVGQRVSVSV